MYGVKKGSAEWERWNLASEFVKGHLKEKEEVIIETIKDKKEKFGRYLAVIYIKIDQNVITGLNEIRSIGDYYCLNDILIGKGLAKKYML